MKRVDHYDHVDPGVRQARVHATSEYRPNVQQTLAADATRDRVEHLLLHVLGVYDALRPHPAGEADGEPAASGADVGDPYQRNPDYDGNSVLGVIAKDDILYTWEMPDRAEINGTLLSVEGRVGTDGILLDENGHPFRDTDAQRLRLLSPTEYALEEAYDLSFNYRSEPFVKESLRRLGGLISEERIVETFIKGRSDGTAFVDVTSPESPVYVGFLPCWQCTWPANGPDRHEDGPPHDKDTPRCALGDDAQRSHGGCSGDSQWRDMEVYADHVYIGSEQGGHGLVVFDLRQLRNVVLATAPA